MRENSNTYVFQLMGTDEVCEVEAEDSAEALRQCLRKKTWPIERVVYLGKKDKQQLP